MQGRKRGEERNREERERERKKERKKYREIDRLLGTEREKNAGLILLSFGRTTWPSARLCDVSSNNFCCFN